MGLERGTIPHLLSGVSQRPDVQRNPTQLRKQDNMLGRWSHGLMRRPPSEHKGLLTNVDLGFWNDVFVHEIPLSESERYLAVVVNGGIKVYNAVDRVQMTVVDQSAADGYLTDATKGFRAATVGDTTVVTNRAVSTAKGPRRSPRNRDDEALIYVTQADYSVLYSITVLGTTFVFATESGADSNSRGAINTDEIAQGLADLLLADPTVRNMMTIEVFGSAIYLRRRPLQLFTFTPRLANTDISVSDGLGGKGLRLIRGRVQVFEDLPRRAKHGMVIEVTGDPLSSSDNYWVRYEDLPTQGEEGVWRETVAPDLNISFDAKKMPHLLTAQGKELGETVMSDPGPYPTLVGGHTTFIQTEGWAKTQAGARDKLKQGDLRNNGDEVRTDLVLDVALPSVLTQTQFSLEISVVVDTTVVPAGVATKLHVELFDGSVTTYVLESRTFLPGMLREELFELEVDKAIKTGAEVRLRLELQKNAAVPVDRLPNIAYREQFINFTGTELTQTELDLMKVKGPISRRLRRPPLMFMKRGKAKITFDTTVTYPKGVQHSIRLDPGGTRQQTVTTTNSSDQTGAQVATTLFGLIDALADYTATNPSAGVVQITFQTAPTAKALTLLYEHLFPGGNLVFYNKDMALVVNAFAGKKLVNKSDGFKATILSNTATTITVNGTTIVGGVTKDLQPGDVCYAEGTGIYFVYGPASWNDRDAGDEETNAFPGFMEKPIQEVFFFRGRLGFTSKENITLSGAADLFNLWRTSVVALLPSDRIDVKAAQARIANFHSAVPWADDLFLWSDNAQFRLLGDPLTAESVSMSLVSSYFNVGDVRPLTSGDVLLYPYAERGHALVYEYAIPTDKNDVSPPQARDLTFEVPAYIPGRVQDWAVDASQGVLALVMDQQVNTVFVFAWTAVSEETRNAGWGRWILPPGSDVKALAFSNAKLLLVVKRADGVWLDEVDLDVDIEPATNERARYLDRRFDETQATSVVFDALNNWTTITLPYSVNMDQATEGEVAVVRRTTPFTRYTVTRPAANQVRVAGANLTGIQLYIGVKYLSVAELGRLYTTGFQSGAPRTYGRTQVHYVDVWFHDTTDFNLRVTGFDGVAVDYPVTEADPRDDKVHGSVSSDTKHATIEVRSSTPGGFRVSSVNFEAYFHDRTRTAA